MRTKVAFSLLLTLCALSFRALPLAAEVISVELLPVSGESLSASERSSIDAILFSYVNELRGFQARRRDDRGKRPPALRWESSVQKTNDGSRLLVTVNETATGEARDYSLDFAGINDLVLGLHGLVIQALSPYVFAPTPEAPQAIVPSLQNLAGYWEGDKGIAIVKISADGQARATLSNGASMKLKLSVEEGKRVIVEQDEPNSPDFYFSPYYGRATAEDIAKEARPMRWTFELSADGTILTGEKESTSVSGDGTGAISIDNDYRRPAAWKKIR
jgi:hypothetical protein